MTVVIFKKTKSGKKRYMTVFTQEKTPDRIINLKARKPLIPNNYIIEEIAVGESFIDKLKLKYNIKKHTTV